MSERRVSTRNRGEPPLKKRAIHQSPVPATPVPPPPLPATERMRDGLPVKLRDGQSLPTLPKQQDLNLSIIAYQTISESGVLAASVERSRQRWLTDGVFDRYWAKPSKKKTIAETTNPAKETMSRLGGCSMIIDPHIFEITLYTVKEVSYSFSNPQGQHGSVPPPQHNPYHPASTYTPSVQPSSFQQNQPNFSHPSLPPFREAFGHFGPQEPVSHHAPLPIVPQAMGPEPASVPRRESTGQGSIKEHEEPKADPVIQMLATRAASDPDLKSLMKVVAAGKASPTQLRDFQDHIDELNAMLKSRRTSPETRRENHSPKLPSNHDPEIAPQAANHDLASGPWAHHNQAITNPPPGNSQIPIKVESSPHGWPPFPNIQSQGTKSDISNIVFDFGGNGDRFAFPRYSILEYSYGGTQVTVSFLVIRRGSTVVSGKYKDTRSYYQPVTMRLTTPQSKTLAPLAKVVAPPEEVRRYMDSVFDKISPAETVHLAIRLPRSSDAEDVATEEGPTQENIHLIKPFYSAPNSLTPLATAV